MQNLYSLAIIPSEEIISFVKDMKNELAKEIGWFHSKNSIAHISLNEFMASDNEIEGIKKQLTRICYSIKPINVHCDKYDTYPNGAFFIAPDTASKNELKKIMKQINQLLQVTTRFKNNEPHISIARQLKPEEIVKAYHLFTFIDLNFLCNSVSLRRFNTTIKQFEAINRFDFNNIPSLDLEQGTLF